jgi:RNA polymerase sigma factor (sigma-70 family)
VIAYLEQDSSLGGAKFRTFLSRVLDRHLRRWAQKYRHAEGGWQGRPASAAAPRQAPPRYEILERLPLSPVSQPDPEAIAEKHEMPQALQRALADLDAWRRSFWDFLAVGMSLHEIAEELGISYEAAKRERRNLLRWLKVRLRGFQD